MNSNNSFNWKDFNDIADILISLNTDAAYRTAINRYYYSTFCHARDYLVICGAGLLFTAGYNMVSAVLRGMGDSKRPFMFIGIASVINLVLDLLFTGAWGMGVAGAALATVISLPQPAQMILTSLPTRATLNCFEPQGCSFFSSMMSFTRYFMMFI